MNDDTYSTGSIEDEKAKAKVNVVECNMNQIFPDFKTFCLITE